MQDFQLEFTFSNTRQKILKTRGVEGNLFSGKDKFDFMDSVCRMNPEIPNIKTKGISTRKQRTDMANLLSYPFRGNQTVGIGSFPSDNRAKLVALNIMNAAIEYQDAAAKRGRRTALRQKNYPLWHKPFGELKDELRNGNKYDNPSMLVVSNVGYGSTNHRIEVVRDILEKYSGVPRIVVVYGCDPLYFFATHLNMPMDTGFYVGADNKVADIKF